MSLSNTPSRLEDAAPYPSRIPPGQFLPSSPGSRLGVKLQFVFTAKKEGGGGRIGWGSGQREGENVSKWYDKFPLFPNPSLSSPFSTFSLGQKNKGNACPQIPNSQLLLLYIPLIVVRESELEF